MFDMTTDLNAVRISNAHTYRNARISFIHSSENLNLRRDNKNCNTVRVRTLSAGITFGF